MFTATLITQLLPVWILAAHPHVIWYLPPLAAAISLVYTASRYEYPPRIISEAFWLFCRGMIILGIALGLLMYLSWNL